MQYTLDFEFDGYMGELISMALVREDLVSMYVGFKDTARNSLDPWVAKNVLPFLNSGPIPIRWRTNKEVQEDLEKFFAGDNHIEIITDWPDDVAYFSKLLLTGPGTMINIPGIKFDVRRIDAYPTRLRGAVQHCAIWDAQALMYKITHPNPPPLYMIVKVIDDVRYYYAHQNEMQEKGHSLGTWTRKRNSASVVHYEDPHVASRVISKWTGDINEASSGQSHNSYYPVSHKNRAHVYYGRSHYAVKVISWLFNFPKRKNVLLKKTGTVKLQVVEVGGPEVGSVIMPIDLSHERAIVKKREPGDALHIDNVRISYDPVTGENISGRDWDGSTLRQQCVFLDVVWRYNPWTGKERTEQQIQDDPFGLNIEYGDNKE